MLVPIGATRGVSGGVTVGAMARGTVARPTAPVPATSRPPRAHRAAETETLFSAPLGRETETGRCAAEAGGETAGFPDAASILIVTVVAAVAGAAVVVVVVVVVRERIAGVAGGAPLQTLRAAAAVVVVAGGKTAGALGGASLLTLRAAAAVAVAVVVVVVAGGETAGTPDGGSFQTRRAVAAAAVVVMVVRGGRRGAKGLDRSGAAATWMTALTAGREGEGIEEARIGATAVRADHP